MYPITIAGAGPLAQALAQRLTSADFNPRLVSTSAGWQADLTNIPEAEVACSAARTLVVLAQTRRNPAKLTKAKFDDVDRLMADSLGRAAKRCGVSHIVLYECGVSDVREPLLRATGIPVSVLRGGGPDPLALLEQLVRRGPGPDVTTQAWEGEVPKGTRPARPLVCSVQRFALPVGWTAERLADTYLEWLPGKVPTVGVETRGTTSIISAFGARALVLRRSRGRSERDCVVFEVPDGALVRRGAADARFEFRVLLDGVTAMTSLIGFTPRLPFTVYRFTQALMHERIMRRFAASLSNAVSPQTDVAA